MEVYHSRLKRAALVSIVLRAAAHSLVHVFEVMSAHHAADHDEAEVHTPAQALGRREVGGWHLHGASPSSVLRVRGVFRPGSTRGLLVVRPPAQRRAALLLRPVLAEEVG